MNLLRSTTEYVPYFEGNNAAHLRCTLRIRRSTAHEAWAQAQLLTFCSRALPHSGIHVLVRITRSKKTAISNLCFRYAPSLLISEVVFL
jgi:hypothetical protein